jgi:hypothetical protein
MGHRNQRVYLSGGMEYAADEGRDWRGRLQEWLEREMGCTVFNPNRESERFLRTYIPGIDFRKLKETDLIRFQQTVAQLVDLDCKEIAERSDYVLCYWDDSAMRGAGTKGELTMARYFGKPVYVVTSMARGDIPGWILGCTTEVFESFEELKQFLLDSH